MAYDYKGQVIRRGNGNIRATRELQQMLKDAGYSPGKIDGSFGAKTEAALRKYQVNNGLDPDMIAGPETWAQLARSAPQPLDNPRRNLDRGPPADVIPAEADSPMGETAPAPMGETAPADLAGQTAPAPGPIAMTAPPDGAMPPTVTGTDQTSPYTRGIDLGGVPDGGRMLRSPFDNAGPSPLPVGAGPGPESSSSAPQEDPAVAQAMQALATQRGRQFIAEALAQRVGGGQGRPSPFAALGGQPPAGAFVSPGAPDIPSPVGMPSWLADRMGQR